MDMKIVALIGYGYWGPNLLRNYMELPMVRVKWVCDVRPERLKLAQARYPSVQVTAEVDRVLADPEVEAVLIATPISSHYLFARAALEAGKHVFVEKPMTASVAQAHKLVELAEARGLTLMVGHTFVYSPPVRKVKEILESGELGDVYFVTTSRVNLGLHQKDVSVVWDLAPHDLSILYYWLGEVATKIAVNGRGCIDPAIPDVAFINLHFPSGVVAEVQASWLSPVKLRRTMVVGSRKMLVYDDTQSVEKVKVYDQGVELQESKELRRVQPLVSHGRHRGAQDRCDRASLFGGRALRGVRQGRPMPHHRRPWRFAGRGLTGGGRAVATQRRARDAHQPAGMRERQRVAPGCWRRRVGGCSAGSASRAACCRCSARTRCVCR